MQTYAQRVVPAQAAALIFVLEPVFAAIFAFLILGERLGLAGWVGGSLVVLAMVLSQLPARPLSTPGGHALDGDAGETGSR